jgi:Bacterial aa3 type cytochrome c oxidase subunit IV
MRVRRCAAVAIALTPQYPSFRPTRRFFTMAEHGTVEYATATGNDYAAHEQGYESFVHFTLVGILYVVTVLFGLATGGVMGNWFLASAIFVIGLLGAIPGLLSRATTPSYVSFVICFLIFAFTGLSPH